MIEAGTLVTIDFGARLDGYYSDCTRTFAAGRGQRTSWRRIHALVAGGAGRGAGGGRGRGRRARRWTRSRASVSRAAGHGEHFGHGLGHGVGLEVHEAPRLAQTAEDTLEAGNVVTVEPGVYVPGLGGVRIEDLVVVTADGTRVLSGHARRSSKLD